MLYSNNFRVQISGGIQYYIYEIDFGANVKCQEDKFDALRSIKPALKDLFGDLYFY